MDGGDGHRERRGGLADAMNVNGGSENDKRKIDERKIVGRDRSSRTTPPHLRVPAQRASGAGRGISRAYDALVKSPGTGQWDPAIIGATLTVTVGQATTVHRRGTPLDEEWDEPGYGVVALPPATRGAYNAAGRRVWLWPAILRHLGRGHGRSPDYRPHGGCSAFVGGGESHDQCETASSMELGVGAAFSVRQRTWMRADANATWVDWLWLARTPGTRRTRVPESWIPRRRPAKAQPPRKRGVHVRLATRCTTPREIASGLSTPSSGPENPAYARRAKPATHG